MEHFAQCSTKCAKKAVLAPFAPYYSTYLFVEQCSTNVPRKPILYSTMIINRLTKTDCATKFRGTLCSTPLFPMFHGMFHGLFAQLNGAVFSPFFAPILPIYVKQFFQLIAPYNNICTCVRAQEGGLYITNLQRWSLLMTRA